MKKDQPSGTAGVLARKDNGKLLKSALSRTTLPPDPSAENPPPTKLPPRTAFYPLQSYDLVVRSINQPPHRTRDIHVALFAYAASTLALTNETVIANGATNAIARSYDTLGRADGFTLGSNYNVDYGYDSAGRFAAVTSSVMSVSSVADYVLPTKLISYSVPKL